MVSSKLKFTTDNFLAVERAETYQRIDSSKPASITYRFTPQTDEEYWVTLPTRFSKNVKIILRCISMERNITS